MSRFQHYRHLVEWKKAFCVLTASPKINSENLKRALAYYACCEAFTIWYAVNKPNTLYGFESNWKLKCKTYSPMKDFMAACAALCFMYLTPRFDKNGNLVKNTKIAMTAPTHRQVIDIMIPEISRLYRRAGFLPGTLLSNGIRTNYEEWYLTGFKSSAGNTEAWSGFLLVMLNKRRDSAEGIIDNAFTVLSYLIEHHVNGVFDIAYLSADSLRLRLHETTELSSFRRHIHDGFLKLFGSDLARSDQHHR